jgi:crotonobetainyl-CoA:carnitine CoA-transferase CaiB-like acyl-CoA transferase
VSVPGEAGNHFAATLEGVRVLELGSNVAGPFAAMILGDAGADVVKIEDPRTGDATRALSPMVDGQSTVFRAFNRGKRSVAVDVTTAPGRESVLRLASTADAVITSLRPGLAEQLGLGFSDIRAVRADTIYCAVSAFGAGPIGSSLLGYDALVQAFSGIMISTGHPDDEDPVRVSASLLDMSTGMWAALGIMAALMRRPSQQGAQLVEACLLDSAFTMMAHQVGGYLSTGVLPERLGSHSPSFAPYGAFPASDGHVFVAAGTDRQFDKLCALLDLADVRAAPRFRTPQSRAENNETLHALLGPRFGVQSVESWVEQLNPLGIPSCRVNDLGRALRADVSCERGLLVDAATDTAVTSPGLLRLPIDASGRPRFAEPPTLGQHTGQVLEEAGFARDEIARLLAGEAQRAAGAEART